MGNRKHIGDLKGWVIVKKDTILEYETFEEAIENNKLLNGNLMSKNYFENHYKDEQD
jgi:hypothetical protein